MRVESLALEYLGPLIIRPLLSNVLRYVAMGTWLHRGHVMTRHRTEDAAFEIAHADDVSRSVLGYSSPQMEEPLDDPAAVIPHRWGIPPNVTAYRF